MEVFFNVFLPVSHDGKSFKAIDLDTPWGTIIDALIVAYLNHSYFNRKYHTQVYSTLPHNSWTSLLSQEWESKSSQCITNN